MLNGYIINDAYKNAKTYDGNTDKFGITVDGINYIVKLCNEFVSSVYSEHTASFFIRKLGLQCQLTYIGWYNNQPAVIIEDFTDKEHRLRSFKDTKQSGEDTDISNKKYTYDDILYMINKHAKMSNLNKELAIRRYVPSFVTQRTIPEGRADLFPTLEKVGLTWNDLFEVMCRTHAVCGNDDYYVSRTPDKVIDVDQRIVPLDIPDFDTREYGWI